jgi:hypothetical protein
MVCRPLYTGCIRRRWPRKVLTEAYVRKGVATDECRLPPGLGGSGQPTFAELYSLSNRC